jgi:hypothetical protein
MVFECLWAHYVQITYPVEQNLLGMFVGAQLGNTLSEFHETSRLIIVL